MQLNQKRILLLLTVINGVFFLAPLLYLCLYAYPNAEDISLSYMPKHVGLLKSVKILYLFNDGRYAANLLMGGNPTVFGWFEQYKWVPFIIFILYAYSVYFVISSVIKEGKIEKMALTTIALTIYWALLPSVIHSLYWVASAIVFTIPIICLNFFIGLYYKITTTKHEVLRATYRILAIFLIIMAIGSNEMSLAFINSVLLIILIVAVKKRNRVLESSYYLGVSVLSTCCFVLSPGIIQRMNFYAEDQEGITFFMTTSDLLSDAFGYSWKMLMNPVFITGIVVMALLIPTSYLRKRNWMIIAGISMFVGITMLFTFYLPMGGTMEFPNRVFNVFHQFLIIAVVCITVPVVQYLGISKQLVLWLYSFFLLINTFHYDNSNKAINFILSGNHKIYKQEMSTNNSRATNSNSDDVCFTDLSEIQSFISHPPHLTAERSQWNSHYEKFYNKRKVEVCEIK